MAKLTHEQRCEYEEYGSVNVSMTDERKVFSDYKILTSAIKKEFIELMKFVFSDEGKKLCYSDKKFSSNEHFVYHRSKLLIVTGIPHHRKMHNHILLSSALFIVEDSKLCICNNIEYEGNDKYMKLKKIVHDYFESELGYEDTVFDTGLRYIYYNKSKVISDDLSKILLNVDYMVYRKMPKYVPPGVPCNLSIGRQEGTVEYFNKGRVVKMKAGKGIRKFFKIHKVSLTDEYVKNATNKLNLKVSDFKLKVVEGSELVKYYSGDYYEGTLDTGSLANSCMRGDECQSGDYFDVYKEHAKMLILINEDTDLIIGRAILWNDATYIGDTNEDEDLQCESKALLMDRIYSSESVYSIFKDWAKDNGYYRKRYQSYSNECLWRSPLTGNEVELEFSMNINLNKYYNVPYMDTFAWGDDNQVINREDYGYYAARGTEGILEGGDNENRDDEYDDDDEW